MPTPAKPDAALAEAITKLTDVADKLATTVSATASPAFAGQQALTRRMRHAQNAKVLGALVAGALIAAAVVPSHKGSDSTDVSTASPAAAGAIDTAGPSAVTPDVSPTSAAPAATPAGSTYTPAPAPSGGGTTAPASSGGGGTAAGGAAAAAANTQSGPGVTANSITIGVVDLDSSDLAPVCPRCGNGPTKDGLAAYALLDKWRKDGRLPVHGRDIKLERRQTKVLDTGQRRASCVEMAQQVKPFAVVVNPVGTFDVAQCLAGEFKQQTISFDAPDEQVLARTPGLYTPHATLERILRNYVLWAHQRGMFKGETLGLYCCSDTDAVTQEVIDRALKPTLAQAGYKLAVEVKSNGQGSGALAVQRFRAAGVTTALLFSDQLAFQQAAKAQGYKPKYPMTDTGYTFTDAVSDITFDTGQMDGNYGMRVKWWGWAQRKPVKAIDNAAAQECLDTYQAYAKRQLDTFDNDAEIEYAISACSVMQLLLKALQNAGPNLTPQTFAQGVTSVRNLEVAAFKSISLTPTRRAGADVFSTWQFKATRWQPSNEYWGRAVPGYQRFYVD